MVVRVRGFSLIELMMTVAVMAVLLMAVSPALSDWMVNVRIRNAASAIEQGLQRARQEAIRRNQPAGFYLVSASASDSSKLDNTCALSDSSGSWVVSLRNPAGKCGTAPSTTVDPMLVEAHAVGDGGQGVAVTATLAGTTNPATTVTFNGLGSVANANPIARVDVAAAANAASHRSLCVEISGVGAARMCDPALTVGDPRACRGACAP